jgi:phosphatidylserine/phosphatidylglycerophosphate/cardiolipin synthase-like enzyme
MTSLPLLLLLAIQTPTDVCFVPDSDCGGEVVRAIDEARTSIRAQAYAFTSRRIAQALARARGRGLDVTILLDAKEAHADAEAKPIAIVLAAGIRVRLDAAHAIAHNKVLVIDSVTVVTGSFNFSVAAERANAENVLFLRNNPALAWAYQDNFARHWAHSQAVLR